MKEKIKYYTSLWTIYLWHILMLILILISLRYFYELTLVYSAIYFIISLIIGYIIKYKGLKWKISIINYIIYLVIYSLYIYLYFESRDINTSLDLVDKTTFNNYWPYWLWVKLILDYFIDSIFIIFWLVIIVVIDLIPLYLLESNSSNKKNKK